MATVGIALGVAGQPLTATATPGAAPPNQGGRVEAWGYNHYGQATIPAQLTSKTVTAVSAGYGQSLALTADGRITAWGLNNSHQGEVPPELDGKTVTAISAGYNHNLALTADGRVIAWGDKGAGQTDVPAALSGKRVVEIAAGRDFSLALTSEGRVVGWGADRYGQVSSLAADGATKFTHIAAGEDASVALDADGNAHAAGRMGSLPNGPSYTGVSTQLGNTVLTDSRHVWTRGGNSSTQTVPASLSDQRITSVAAGLWHDLALTADGRVTAWGENRYGQLNLPTPVTTTKVLAVAAGFAHNLAIVDATGTPPAAPQPTVNHHLEHTIRGNDGSWTEAVDAGAAAHIPGTIVRTAAVSTPMGAAQLAAVTTDGRLWFTQRAADQTWSTATDLGAAAGLPTAARLVAGTATGSGQPQFIILGADGLLWHTIRKSDGNWQRAGNATAAAGMPASLADVAATSSAPGEAQFAVATAGGQVYHAVRNPDGSWQTARDLAGSANIRVRVTRLAATSSRAGQAEFLLSLYDGSVVVTTRRPDGSWIPIDYSKAIGVGSLAGLLAVAAAPTGVPGEDHLLMVDRDNHLWHTIRRANGSWDNPGDAGAASAMSEQQRITSVSAVTVAAGELQVMASTVN